MCVHTCVHFGCVHTSVHDGKGLAMEMAPRKTGQNPQSELHMGLQRSQ